MLLFAAIVCCICLSSHFFVDEAGGGGRLDLDGRCSTAERKKIHGGCLLHAANIDHASVAECKDDLLSLRTDDRQDTYKMYQGLRPPVCVSNAPVCVSNDMQTGSRR